MRKALFAVVVVFLCTMLSAQQATAPVKPTESRTSSAPSTGQKTDPVSTVIPKGATIFIAPMQNGFDEYMKSAIANKKVPVVVTQNRDEADFEITGTSESQKAGAAKIIIMGSWHSRETASIKVANIKSGVVAFAYSYDTNNSAHGKKTSSESCAKHLKEKIESGK
jgi:hypothetical protein